MSILKIAKNNRTFLLDNNHFFYLADTCWSAFTNIGVEEWKYYLETRKQQGFNTLQINILPQWDRSVRSNEVLPFGVNIDKSFNFNEVNNEYFDKAREMCLVAKDYGFQLALVVLWCNYVPNTWASNINSKNIMPVDFLEKYFDVVLEKFDDLKPIYLISGDTDFENNESINYYDKALKYFCEKSKDTLKTLHIRGREEKIPETLVKNIDFYMYQSGHNSSNMHMPYYLGEVFYNKNPKKPVINSEPCYEQMGYSRKVYGRFDRFDVRKAAWQSVLSGGCGGLTYGAHGVWSWHTIGTQFSEEIGEAFDSPMLWQNALQLKGATDYGMLKYILESNNLINIIPRNDLLVNETSEIRFAINDENTSCALYIPSNTNVKIKADLSKFKFYLFDLAERNIVVPNVKVVNGVAVFGMHTCIKDVVILGKK